MYCTGGLYDRAYKQYTLSTYGERLDYASISADAKAELPAVIAEYEKIIKRMKLSKHLRYGTLSDAELYQTRYRL